MNAGKSGKATRGCPPGRCASFVSAGQGGEGEKTGGRRIGFYSAEKKGKNGGGRVGGERGD